MKQLLKGLIPLAMLVGIFLGAAPAQAVTLTPVTNNGVTCQRHDGGTYPEDGHYYSCGTNASNDANVLTTVTGTLAAYSQVRTKLQGGTPVSFYVFDKATDDYKFQKVGAPTPAELQAWYDSQVNANGYSSTTAPYRIVSLNNVGTSKGNPSQPTTPANVGEVQFTALHEMGHRFDAALGNKSDSQLYLRLTEKDQISFDVHHQTTAPGTRLEFTHWITRDEPSAIGWHELYAQEFAAYVQKNNTFLASAHPIQAAVFDQADGNFYCTQLVVARNILFGTDPNSVQLGSKCAMPAAGPVLCYEYRPSTHKGFPLPDPRNDAALAVEQFHFNAFYCGRTAFPARTAQLFDALAPKLHEAIPSASALGWLESTEVKYYFFNNKAEAIDFFAYQEPYNTNSLYQGNNSQARCGSTFYNASGKAIAVAIYDNCEVLTADGSSIQNPDLLRTAIYQSGHAYNWAIERTFGASSRPDDRPGFTTYFNYDVANVGVNSTTFATYNAAQKTAMICQAFGTVGNSKIERALGATTTNTGPVCTAGSVNSPWRSGTTYHTPTQIAGNDKKIPSSFTTTAFVKRELWAEVFTLLVMGGPPTDPTVFQNWLPITDTLMSTTAFPKVGGVTPPRAFNCTRSVIETYVNNTAHVPVAGCPAVSAGDL